ncbi:hypothetical protein PISMIDRAFT_675332 [Pisolithus microcarpus 441]|uniref:Uncharacterized protein n=1 Tax=Pisolithus microcarpus 441 TaxID=765257 RepID=A0A0C9ZMD2_9AGAM|nr:hypothetical protein PISMIDRAFT_675332 [Pisolithus microcarpus 441]
MSHFPNILPGQLIFDRGQPPTKLVQQHYSRWTQSQGLMTTWQLRCKVRFILLGGNTGDPTTMKVTYQGCEATAVNE